MSYADHKFVSNCEDILKHGSSDEGLPVRAHWEDGTPAYTKMRFNVSDRYRLSKHSVPVITLRKLNFKACVDEILWIYQKHSNNVNDLNSHIWDAWADENGSIGRAYGYQIGELYKHHIYTPGEDLSDYPSATLFDEYGIYVDLKLLDKYGPNEKFIVWMNQIDGVIWTLRNNPTDRGIMTNMYNHQDLAAMALRPCAYSMTFNVEHRNGTRYLHGLLNQRSQDMLTANGWNVTQYAVLLQMIAQVCDMVPVSLTHMVANMHIYDRHIPIVEKMIGSYYAGQLHKNPTFWINPEVKSFKDFTVDDVRLENYQYNDISERIEVAV